MANWGNALLAGASALLDTKAQQIAREKEDERQRKLAEEARAIEDARWMGRQGYIDAKGMEKEARQAAREDQRFEKTAARDDERFAQRTAVDQQIWEKRLAMESKLQAARDARLASLKGAGGGENKEIADYNARSAIAEREGLQGEARKAFVTTGKLPNERSGTALTAGDRAAIREADDKVLSTTNTMGMLGEALKLNDKSYDGAGASWRAAIAKQFGSEAANNTVKLDNIIRTQALENLKATFGGNPTEGERAILLEIQGSPNETAENRKDIYQRAQKLVESKQKFNQDRAAELRGGTYYDPKSETAPIQPTAAAPSGAPSPGTVMDGYRFKGGDPRDQSNWEPI